MTIDLSSVPNNMGVYQILNTVSGKSYIGCSVKMRNRLQGHLKALRRGNHYYKLQSAWDKHGAEAFVVVVLAEILDQSELLRTERDLIIAHDTVSKGYNIVDELGKNRLGATNTEEHNRKVSEALTGRKRTPEQIEAMRERSRQQWADPEKRALLEAKAKERASRPEEKARLLEMAGNTAGTTKRPYMTRRRKAAS